MSDQTPNDTPQEETQTETPTSSQTQSSNSNPLQMVIDTVGSVWKQGSGSGLIIKDSDGHKTFTLHLNMLALLLLSLLIGFLPAVILLVAAGLISQFVYNAAFSFGKFDQDAP